LPDLLSFLPVMALAFAGSIIGGMTGYGAGLLLPLVLVPLVGPVPVVPIIALGAIANNVSRAGVFRAHIDREKALSGALFALPGAALTAWGYTLLSGRTVQIVIGTVLLAMVVARHILKALDRHVSGGAFRAMMAVYGGLTGGTTGAGVVLVSILMAAGLTGASVIATDAAITVALTLMKVAMFAAGGLIGRTELWLGGAIALVAIPGAFIARWLVERMPVRVHTAILDGVVICGACIMLWHALRG
jgi:uncharacterized protein